MKAAKKRNKIRQDVLEGNERSEQFFTKLKTFQSKSKDKVKTSIHKNIWIEQLSKLLRKENHISTQLQIQISEGAKNSSKYQEINQISNQLDLKLEKYEKGMFYFPNSFRSLLEENKKAFFKSKDKTNINSKEIRDKLQKPKKPEKREKRDLHEIQNTKDFKNKITKTQEILLEIKNSMDKIKQNLDLEYEEARKECEKFPAFLTNNQNEDELAFKFKFTNKNKNENEEINTDFITKYHNLIDANEIENLKNAYVKHIELLRKSRILEIELHSKKMPDQSILSKFKESELFIIKTILQEYQDSEKRTELIIDRLKKEFPNLNSSIIETAINCLEAKRWHKSKEKAIRNDYKKEELEFKAKTEHIIAEEIKYIKENMESEIEKYKQESKTKESHKLHLVNLEKYKIKMAEIERCENERKKELEELEIKKQNLINERIEKTKMEAIQFKKLKKEEEENKRHQQDIEQEEIEKLKKEEIQKNKPKVQRRIQIEKEKIDKKINDKIKQKQDIVENEKKMNDIIENYNFRPQVEADKERLESKTISLLRKGETLIDEGENVELFKNYGYNIDQLMNDIRYKISATFSEQGLSNLAYAHTLLKGTESNLIQRPDIKSTMNRLS